jgi:hypothetical protein
MEELHETQEYAAERARRGERRSGERRRGDRRIAKTLDLGTAIIGYRIEAPDGYVGRAVDFCVEEESSVVTGLLAKTGRLLPWGRRVFVPLSAIERIDPAAKKIYVGPAREEVRSGSRRNSRPR